MKGYHTSVPVVEHFVTEPAKAFTEWAEEYRLRWLLAHADDGVIWGEMRADGMYLSSDAFPHISPPLRAVTLQQARLFGPDAELLLWRDGNNWRARLIRDGAEEGGEYYDESYLLWGTAVEERRNGFALLREGKEGLRHAPPLPDNAHPPVHLKVRHYVAYDADGQAYIAYSRLTGIDTQGGEQ